MDCAFCKIAAGELPSTIEYQDDEVMAFRDIHPSAPVHVLVIPKKHIDNILELEEFSIFEKVKRVVKKLNLINYKIVINGGDLQEVKHLHIHLMSERG